MKRHTWTPILSGVLVAAALTGGALALGGGDSLVSLTYLKEKLLPPVRNQMEQTIHAALQQSYDQAAAQVAGEAGSGTPDGQYSSSFQRRTFGQGDTITLPTGSGVLAMPGSVLLTHNGVVVDVTEGVEVPSNSLLTTGHRYLVGEDTSATLQARSGVLYLGLEGSFTHTDSQTQALPFWDVAQGDWFEEPVRYVYETGLFSGMGADYFAPSVTMNRAMLVTVLYRVAGSPEEELNQASIAFEDVPPDSWYAPYVRWGAEQGVTAGVGDGFFAPDQSVTRQQVLVMLHSFAANRLGLDVGGGADLSGYADQAQVAPWARDAVSWAVAKGLIVPSVEGTLRPEDTASRAEVATILMKFDSLY